MASVKLVAPVAVPVGDLTPYPGNPRIHNVAAIAESLTANGQYRPIVVQLSTSYVLAGNGTLAAAVSLGWESVHAQYVDVDDTTARRIVLADNRTGQLGGFDVAALSLMVESLPSLTGTGYAPVDVEDLRAQVQAQTVTPDEWEAAFTGVDREKPPFQAMTFTLHDSQVETVAEALRVARARGPFDTPNENSNGNALAHIVETFLTLSPDG